MSTTLWAAFGGFALGSFQSLFLDWLRERARHRRQLRQWRNELRRLVGFDAHFSWSLENGPPRDFLPNPPRITSSYRRLLDETDFWTTDAHEDDNTGLALINIADGAEVLQHYYAEALKTWESLKELSGDEAVEQWSRTVDTTRAYDVESARWLLTVRSAQEDVDRRIGLAGVVTQLRRVFRRMRSGSNPPNLPPLTLEI